MKIVYTLLALVATAIACSCAAPDTESGADPRPIVYSEPGISEEASSGSPPVCTLTQSCTVNRAPGKCALSPSTGLATCCTGCVDSGGYCRAGNQWASECGANGSTCAQCQAGKSCSSSGVCVSNCGSPGADCSIGGVLGAYGNGPNGTCVCCTGCFDPDSGLCANSGDLDCGRGGSMCTTCGGNIPYCVSGSCVSCNDGNPCTVDSAYNGACTHSPAPGSTSCGTNSWCYQGWGTCCANGCNNQLADGTYECVSPSCPSGKTCVNGFCS